MSHRLDLLIGGTRIEFQSPRALSIDACRQPFISKPAESDLMIRVRLGHRPFRRREQILGNGTWWSCDRTNRGTLFHVRSPHDSSIRVPYDSTLESFVDSLTPEGIEPISGSRWRLVGNVLEGRPGPYLPPDLHVHSAGSIGDLWTTGEELNPFAYPIDELLFIDLWGRRPGKMLLHGACALDGAAYVLAGPSGAGKSTLSQIWSRQGAQILSDDRTLIEPDRAHGTPWSGTGGYSEPGSAPLGAILLVRHGAENSLRRLGAPEAAARLLAVSFLPVWNSAGVENALATVEQVVARVPCWEYAFVPDRSAVEHLREAGLVPSGARLENEVLPR